MASTSSRQPRLTSDKDLNTTYFWTFLENASPNAIPEWGSASRGEQLRAFAKREPILAGAIATMSSKATALDWKIEGGRNRVRRYHEMLGEAEDGLGWSYFLDRAVQDYICTDLGAVVELARETKNGPVSAIYNLDSTACTLTGNAAEPILYSPKVGAARDIRLRLGDFARAVDMPSPDESKFGLGFCAVSRALKAAQVLMALYQYEEEQLSDLPPQGIAAITGMTAGEVEAAFARFHASRQNKEQLTFKGVLWLAATANPMQQIGVSLTPFSNLPPHFDKQTVLTLYVYTLSLDFGVDVREFWPASQAGATKAEAEIQHQKAKGKGFGRLLSDLERVVNWEILPDGLEFSFDQKDSEDDLTRQRLQRETIEKVRRVWEPPMGGEGLITTDEARRWLIEEGVLPDWMATSPDVTSYGSENEVEQEAEAAQAPLQATAAPEAAIPPPPGEETRLAQKAARLRLGPGEDLVAVDRAGDVRTLWTARKSYAIRLPFPLQRQEAAPEAGAASPFGWWREMPYP